MGSYMDKASRDILIYYIAAQIIVAYLYLSENDVEDQNEVERARLILRERQKFTGIQSKSTSASKETWSNVYVAHLKLTKAT